MKAQPGANGGRIAAAQPEGRGLAPGLWSSLALTAGLGLAGLLASALQAQDNPEASAPDEAAETADQITISHGITTFNGDPLALAADFPHLPYVNPDAPKGGEISLPAVLAGFDSMNPYSVQGRAAQGSSSMLETILTGTADEIGVSYCFMCTTLEYPADRSWVIFNLREDIRFSDGTPLTADDVIFSYEILRDKGLSDFRQVLGQLFTGAEALGPYRVKFSFAEGVPTRDLPEMAGGLPVLSKAHYLANDLDLAESSMTPFLGSGPYVPQPGSGATSIRYLRNPDYWAEDLPFGRGMNNYDVIRYEYFAEANTAFEAFKGGIYTFRQENVARQWAQNYTFPAVQNGLIRLEELELGTKANGQSWVFNLRRPAWQDARVREAVGLMFNFEWSNRALFYGAYNRIDSFWENSWLAAEGPPGPQERALLQPLVDDGLLPATILTDPPFHQPVSSADRQIDRTNRIRAAALLDEAGWQVRPQPPGPRMALGFALTAALGLGLIGGGLVMGPRFEGRRQLSALALLLLSGGFFLWARAEVPGAEDGFRRNAQGELLRLEFLDDNPSFERIIAPYVENLRSLGIDAWLNSIDSAQYEVRTRNPDYDFDVTGSFTPTSYVPSSELKQYFGSETADISVFNLAGLKSPAVDRMIEITLAAASREEMTIATHALDRVLRAERFRVPMWYSGKARVAYYDMYEHPARLPPYGTGELSWWWINAEKAAALRARRALQ